MKNHKFLKITKIILAVFWYFQLALITAIILIGLFLFLDVEFIDLNYLNGFQISFSKITFAETLIYDGVNYDFTLTNGNGRLHIDDFQQKFVYLKMLAALVDSFIYLMIIYFLRKIFKNLTENRYFISANGLYIKKIAYSIIFLSFVPQLIQYLTDYWIINTIELRSISIKNEFDFGYQTVILGLLVFVISIVFLRGIELKEDKDLTI